MMMDDGHSTTDTRIGMTTKKNPYYQRWPALRDARLFLGLGDGACANLGSKCSIPTRIACTVGTSAAARICLPLPMMRRRRCCNNDNEDDDDDAANASFSLVEPGLFCYRIDRFHVLVGGALTDGGSVVEWLADLLNRPVSSDSFQECLRQAETLLDESYYNYEASSSSSSLASSVRRTAPPPLTVVPFFSGERSTGFRTGATGAMLGLTLETTPAHVLKACLEGVTLRINAIVQLIQKAIRVKTGTTTKTLQSGAALVGNDDERLRIICSGKALEVNALWRQMLADCTGLDVVMDEQTQEGTSRGVVVLLAAALLAAASNGGGGGDDIREDGRSTPMTGYDGGMAVEHIDDSNTSVPRKNARGYWNQASLSQESLIEAVSPFYSR